MLREYAATTRTFLNELNEAVRDGDTAYRATIRQQVSDLLAFDDQVLLHDDLEGDNDPRFFHEFMAHAKEHRLQYLGDAYLRRCSDLESIPQALERIRHVGDRLTFEQYLDFLYSRSLRATLLCHAETPLAGEIVPAAVRALWIVSDAKPLASSVGDVRIDGAPTIFKGADCTLSVATPVAKAALIELAIAAPRPIRFAMLVERVHKRLESVSIDVAVERELIDLAIEWFATRLIELTAFSPAVATEVDERPCASDLAREQARRGWGVTNLFHRRIHLDGEVADPCAALFGRHARPRSDRRGAGGAGRGWRRAGAHWRRKYHRPATTSAADGRAR